jgi:hypothetical protein
MIGDDVDDFALAPDAPVHVDRAGGKDDPPLAFIKRRLDVGNADNRRALANGGLRWRAIYDIVVRQPIADERRAALSPAPYFLTRLWRLSPVRPAPWRACRDRANPRARRALPDLAFEV